MLRLKRKHIAVVPIDDPETTPGGIIIPDQAKDRTDQGIVKYVGPGCDYIEPLDYVIYGGYTGKLLFVEGEGRLIIMEESFVVAKVAHEEIDSVLIPNVYYRTRDGFTEATYETVIGFITYAIGESSIIQDKQKWNVRQVTEKSKKSQYRVMAESR